MLARSSGIRATAPRNVTANRPYRYLLHSTPYSCTHASTCICPRGCSHDQMPFITIHVIEPKRTGGTSASSSSKPKASGPTMSMGTIPPPQTNGGTALLVAAPPVARRKRTRSWRCLHHLRCPNCRRCLHHQRRALTKGDEEDTPGGDDVLLRGVLCRGKPRPPCNRRRKFPGNYLKWRPWCVGG